MRTAPGINMTRTSALLALLAPLAFVGPACAGDPPDPLAWPAVTTEKKPWTRWWWLGSAVRPAENSRAASRSSRRPASAASRSARSTGRRGRRTKYIDFLSPKWMAMLAHTTTEAKRLGLGVDLTTGTGWPFGGPSVTAADASAKVVVQKYDVAAGKGLTQASPAGTLRALIAYPAEGEAARPDRQGQGRQARLGRPRPASGSSTPRCSRARS